MPNRAARAFVATATVVGAYALVHRLGRTYGSTAAERAARLPGDELVLVPQITTNHAVTVDAPPDAIWPWLVQMGWHRGGWYTARWVDALLFPANAPSADRIHPEWQDLEEGDLIPDGPPEAGCSLEVVAIHPARHLVLLSTSHVPRRWRNRSGARVHWSWVFVLEPLDDGRTRLLFRSRCRLRPWWVSLAYWLVIVPADFVMSRDMLRGIKRRAERIRSG